MNGGGILDDFKNAFNRPQNALMRIILINLIVFLVLLFLEVILTITGAEQIYAMIVNQLTLASSLGVFILQPWTLITYFFTHTGFFHVLFNLLWLYWFGKIIMEFLGSNRLLSLYVLGGIAGGLFYMLIYNILPFFASQVDYAKMLGASAGVFAVVVAAATLYPNYTFFLFLIGPVKIKYIALFYVIVSFAETTGSNAGGNLAHLGGALLGFLFIRQLQKGTDLGKPVIHTLDYIQSFFVSKPKIKVTYSRKPSAKAAPKTAHKPNSNQEEIDLILDKISESGYESLSKEEKQKLFNASKK